MVGQVRHELAVDPTDAMISAADIDLAVAKLPKRSREALTASVRGATGFEIGRDLGLPATEAMHTVYRAGQRVVELIG